MSNITGARRPLEVNEIRSIAMAALADFLKSGRTWLLITVSDAGPEGITTKQLFDALRTTGYGQITLQRAVNDGLIKRKEGEPPGPGQFPPVYNVITPRANNSC